jgi:hypothetical protein
VKVGEAAMPPHLFRDDLIVLGFPAKNEPICGYYLIGPDHTVTYARAPMQDPPGPGTIKRIPVGIETRIEGPPL